MLAEAPIAKKRARMAAAVGTETGRELVAEPLKRSMMRPMVKGMERDTLDETNSCVQRKHQLPSSLSHPARPDSPIRWQSL